MSKKPLTQKESNELARLRLQKDIATFEASGAVCVNCKQARANHKSSITSPSKGAYCPVGGTRFKMSDYDQVLQQLQFELEAQERASEESRLSKLIEEHRAILRGEK